MRESTIKALTEIVAKEGFKFVKFEESENKLYFEVTKGNISKIELIEKFFKKLGIKVFIEINGHILDKQFKGTCLDEPYTHWEFLQSGHRKMFGVDLNRDYIEKFTDGQIIETCETYEFNRVKLND